MNEKHSSAFRALSSAQQTEVREALRPHPFFTTRRINHLFFVKHLETSYQYFSELMAISPVSPVEFQHFQQIKQSHKRRASQFGGGISLFAFASFVRFIVPSNRSIPFKIALGFLFLNFSDAIYDSAMYLQFFCFGPYYFNRLLSIDTEQSIAPHLTGCFVEERLQHEVMRDKGYARMKSPGDLVIVKVWRNIAKKRIARWFNVK